MSDRPRVATLITEVHFSGYPTERDWLLLTLTLTDLRHVLDAYDTSRAVAARVGPGYSALELVDRVLLLEMPPDLARVVDGWGSTHAAVPVHAQSGLILRPQPAYAGKLVLTADTLHWRVLSWAYKRGFATGDILPGDLLEWLVLMEVGPQREDAFRRLAAWDPDRALLVLEHGTCLSDGLILGDPPRVDLPTRSLDVLLGHEDRSVRERAISLVGKLDRGTRVPRTGP